MSEPAPSGAHLLRDRVVASGTRIALRSKVGGVWEGMTWNEVDRAAREIAQGLMGLGIQKGDRVAILCETRAEWVLAEFGAACAGAAVVPIYPTSTAEQCAYLLEDAGVKVAFVENPAQMSKIPGAAGAPRVVCIEPGAAARDRAGALSLSDLRSQGRDRLRQDALALDQRIDELSPDEMWSIVYTSGTTGVPKGVVLTHRNLCSECAAVSSLLPIDENDEQLIFLPLAHIFGRLLSWITVERGMTLTFAEGVQQIAANLRETRPTFMGAVPRVYEKVYGKIRSGAAQAGGAKKAIFDFALRAGLAASRLRQRGESLPPGLAIRLAVADRLVFAKIRAAFGGRIKFFISGGAPLSRDIAEFFHAAGVLILEGWGLTETTAATCVNRPGGFRFGTVGSAVPGIEIRIAQDGEILVRGAAVMREYYKKPEATAEALDAEGWFHTGDVGVIEDAFLRITDRKKDLIVTSVGKNVAPQALENALKAQTPLISQVMVYGDRRPYLVALITLSEEAVVPWARDRGVSFSATADLARSEPVRAAVQAAVDAVNGRNAAFEHVRRFHIVERDFTQEAGELTPTLKVKRKVAEKTFAAELARLYEGHTT
jgi:long-chain acyl-CoA synthetase